MNIGDEVVFNFNNSLIDSTRNFTGDIFIVLSKKKDYLKIKHKSKKAVFFHSLLYGKN